MIVIVDYKMGNLGSITNMLHKLGFSSIISSDKEIIKNASKLILPGVGSFDSGMKFLRELDLVDLLNTKVLNDKTPILGICLGAQLMTHRSDEGTLEGLKWLDAEVLSFKSSAFSDFNLPVPNMGWREVFPCKNSLIHDGFSEDPRFYFVHSYYLNSFSQKDILLTSNYGIDFTAALEKENIVAVQFHPEKSHKYGFKLLENFVKKF